VVAVMGLLYMKFSEKAVEGTKKITIEIVGKDKKSTTYELKTDAEYLSGAMEDARAKGLDFVGVKDQYGLVINTINGDTADFTKDNAYWGFYVNGEYCNYGVDAQPVEDGDAFKIEYTVFVAQ